jgi:hypothetical protein
MRGAGAAAVSKSVHIFLVVQCHEQGIAITVLKLRSSISTVSPVDAWAVRIAPVASTAVLRDNIRVLLVASLCVELAVRESVLGCTGRVGVIEHSIFAVDVKVAARIGVHIAVVRVDPAPLRRTPARSISKRRAALVSAVRRRFAVVRRAQSNTV